MGTFFDALQPKHRTFITKQPMFFVASATGDSRVNCSPKGGERFRVIDERTVGYLDLVGSGNETAAHVMHDGRLTILFCSFEASPLILRLYGRGEIVRPGTEAWAKWSLTFGDPLGRRQIVLLHVESVQTSCGFGVPEMSFVANRPTMREWCEKKGEAALATYERTKNATSIDGLRTPSAVG